MVGVLGFEPRKCRSQSPMPYHLAIPQYLVAKRPFATLFYCIGKIEDFCCTTRLIYLRLSKNALHFCDLWTSKALLSLTSNYLIE